MKNLFFTSLKARVSKDQKRTLLKFSFLLFLFFSFSNIYGQITNNYIDYTNGVHQTICATPSENGNASLTAPDGTVFTTVKFASYGTPNGSCPSFTTSLCNAASSQSIAEAYLLGQSGTINIPATNAIFSDPCNGIVKRLYISVTYTQPICSGTSPGTINGTSPSGVLFPGYSWEKSTVGPTAGFTSTGVTTQDYHNPGNLTKTTWFRRKVSGFLLSDNYSPVLQINVVSPPVASVSSTATCVGGSTGTITGTGSGGLTPYSYGIDGVTYQSGNTFSGLSAGNYTLYVKSSSSCVASTPATVSAYATSTGNQNAAGINSWIGHAYDGTNFSNYVGTFSQSETFDQNFGGITTCFPVTSSAGASSIYTETFSVRYRMNSTKKGLYVVDLGSDDGSRLTVDGTLLYNDWGDHGFKINPRILMNLTGNSSLNYEFYENGGGNQVVFQNLTLILANTLSTNTSQTICTGSNGVAISGDIYGTLPGGIAISGTGYQWAYSTTSDGIRTNISGATGATFIPNTSTAPFNTPGTYYFYRKAILTSSNNFGAGSYTAMNESNAATVTVKATPSATISYAGSPYCSSGGTATVTLSGTTGGTFTSDAGLKLDATGAVELANSSVGSHTVTYSISATSGCAGFSTIATITITKQPHAEGFYPANPYCSDIGTLYPAGSQQGLMGTLSATPPGLSINSATGIINVATSSPGSYTVIYSVPANGGCAAYSASAPLIINTAPSAIIKYNGSPYCSGSGTATVSRNGTLGGTFSSTEGLSINTSTGKVDLVSSTPGTYEVTYTIDAANGCAKYTTTTNITIAPKVSSLVFTMGASSTRCQAAGTVVYSANANNTNGITYSLDATSLGAGNSINSSTGAVTFVAGWEGSSTIKAVAAGCTPLTATHTVTTSPATSGNISTTYTCIDGSSGTITATGNGGISPFTYSLNGSTFQSSGIFSGLSAGNYSIQIKSNDGCIYSTSSTVTPYPNSSGNQSAAGVNTWIGYIYNGKNFDNYKGYFTENEIFDESFGGSGNCFPITSNVPGSSIYTEQFSAKFKMNSSRKGLYVVDLGSDDGSRLTVNSELIFNDWNDHAFAVRPNVLMNLEGNSSLLYEFYENGGSNRVLFNNLTLVLENKLSSNLTQSICMGNSGTPIGGDTYGTLPSGISKYGTTGYQWTYSTTAGGTASNISGATGATFTPNTSTAPFNVPGAYYVYRNAILSSTSNTGKSPYVATNISNVATIIINEVPSATISYNNTPFCHTSSMTEKVKLTGTLGGTFSAVGLQINSATGDIVPNENSVGLYTINYSIPATGGCSTFSTSTQIYIGAAGTWSGKTDNNWGKSVNWICGIIPDRTMDVTIPKQVSNFPSVITYYAEAKNLDIANGASLTVLGTLKISGTISNSGTLDATAGTIEMNGTSAQNISGSMFVNKAIRNLIVSNTSGTGLSVSSTTGDTLKITGALTFGSGTSKLNTGDNLTFVSNSLGTARLGTVAPGNTITGKVIVERYINTGTGAGQHGKSWQFLSAPTYGQTIKESWMENGNLPGNYGTMISGPGGIAAGFDMYSVAPSMKYFDLSITGNWKGVSGANDIISNTGGYMVFIRGDRTVTGTTQAANATILRSKGTLFTGTQLSITVKANSFQSVGNPYASPIDFALITKDANVDNAFYVYDPYLYGNYGVGGYQTLSSVNNWKPVPGGTNAYPVNVLSSVIQSGQAFFVHSNSGTDGSLTISEDSKSAVARPGHSNREATASKDRQFLRASLITSSGLMADGNVVAFDNSFRNAIDGNDVIKLSNSGENFGIKSAGKLLSIEAKSPLSAEDTITYNIANLSKATYKLIFAPENMTATGLQGTLIDKYLKTETAVSLIDSTFIDVDITSNVASKAADRFKLVFRQMATLPVSITSVSAKAKDADNIIEWNVANESGIRQYEVEKSKDGSQFSQVAVTPAANTVKGNYSVTDKNVSSGTNYYRIKIVSVDGKASYSNVVKVTNGKQQGSLSVYPNPITEGIIHLQLNNLPAGKYQIKLYNAGGQVLISKTLNHTEGNSSEDIKCDNLPKGAYQLQINKPETGSFTIRIIKN